MIPDSTGIVIDVASVQRRYAAKMPDWQFRGRLDWMGQRGVLSYKAGQKRINRNALPSCFICKASLCFLRNFDAHGYALHVFTKIDLTMSKVLYPFI